MFFEYELVHDINVLSKTLHKKGWMLSNTDRPPLTQTQIDNIWSAGDRHKLVYSSDRVFEAIERHIKLTHKLYKQCKNK